LPMSIVWGDDTAPLNYRVGGTRVNNKELVDSKKTLHRKQVGPRFGDVNVCNGLY